MALLCYRSMKYQNEIHFVSGIQRLFYFLLYLQLKFLDYLNAFNTDLSEYSWGIPCHNISSREVFVRIKS